MTIFRRFWVLQVLLLWQGGFLFYTSFVVPTGTTVLGSAAAQGSITARVTDALNILGVAGLAVLAWDFNYGGDPDPRRTRARWWCWGVMLVCQWWLFYLHLILDSFMDPGRSEILIRPWFYPVHRGYLWASTVQWFAGVLLAWLTLAAWRSEDSRTARQ